MRRIRITAHAPSRQGCSALSSSHEVRALFYQHPRTERDFAHLPAREASIAAYIDRLPEGADISVKKLAKVLPYGQCALRTSLNRLQDAGHLRRGSERGATEAELLRALADGLPTPVHHPAALVRRRLTDKMPPERVTPAQQQTVLRTLECSECRSPGSTEALIGGRCRPRRGESVAAPAGPGGAVPADGVRGRMNDVRAGPARRSVRPKSR
ncbi:hypothetical protein [Streptomyces sp. NPDC058240]|uniref:hypothetical protein n=1 Tax=Streptomyces sp. NPDC058240 TaxID=3346396 RepID=UPI0036E9431C